MDIRYCEVCGRVVRGECGCKDVLRGMAIDTLRDMPEPMQPMLSYLKQGASIYIHTQTVNLNAV